MGYNTDFEGVLYFKNELKASELALLSQYLEESAVEHPEWEVKRGSFDYIDLELTKDFNGLKWDGSEKTTGMVEAVNFLISKMKEHCPYFGLEGHLLAQGEEIKDRWILEIGDDGKAYKVDKIIEGKVVKCPNCLFEFEVKENCDET